MPGQKLAMRGARVPASFSSASGSIGFIFPTGLDLAGLAALLSNNTVSRSFGSPLVPFDLIVVGDGPVVPEPSTYAMAAIGLLGLIAYNRRRRWA